MPVSVRSAADRATGTRCAPSTRCGRLHAKRCGNACSRQPSPKWRPRTRRCVTARRPSRPTHTGAGPSDLPTAARTDEASGVYPRQPTCAMSSTIRLVSGPSTTVHLRVARALARLGLLPSRHHGDLLVAERRLVDRLSHRRPAGVVRPQVVDDEVGLFHELAMPLVDQRTPGAMAAEPGPGHHMVSMSISSRTRDTARASAPSSPSNRALRRPRQPKNAGGASLPPRQGRDSALFCTWRPPSCGFLVRHQFW